MSSFLCFFTSSSREHGQLTSSIFSKSAHDAWILSSFSGIAKNEFGSIVLYDNVNGLQAKKKNFNVKTEAQPIQYTHNLESKIISCSESYAAAIGNSTDRP